MPSARLQQQFIRLWQCCEGKSQDTTLNELAALLSCSRRHMRTLLNTMQDRGWLTWEAEVGRGKRSRLTFLYTGLALQQQRAEDLLEQDRIDQLVQLVGDKATVRQMLVSHLGRSFRQGRHILRVLYYRPLRNLLPGSALRRSETHIARQIFSSLTRINEENGELERHILRVLYYRPLRNLLPGSALRRSETHIARQIFSSLTRINEENGELEADIAHHWQQISPLHWRFFLRPGVHFHHGRELEMDDVIASLKRINTLPLYSHIADILSPTPWTLDIHLTQPDRWLPLLLGQVPAMILPREWETLSNFASHPIGLPREWETLSNFASHPIGTGPYAVIRNSTNQLKIQAFDDFFGYRALIDEVNVWVLTEIADEPAGGLMLKGPQGEEQEIESRLEEGCYYLLFDNRTHRGANQQVRDWVSYVLSPTNLLYFAEEQYKQLWFPAYGLLPRWHHTRTRKSEKPAGLESLTLTFYQDHIEHRVIAGIMQQILASHQVTLEIKEISYDQWHQGLGKLCAFSN